MTTPQQPTDPSPARPTMPPATDVPDDRIHGDDLRDQGQQDRSRQAGAFGDEWLRPTLGTSAGPSAPTTTASAPYPGPGGGPAHRSNARSWLIAGAGAMLVLGSTAGLFSWDLLSGGGFSHSQDETMTYTQPISSLRFNGGSSDVEVLAGAPSGRVEVTRHYSWGPRGSKPAVNETVSGGTLAIESNCEGSFLGWCSIDYTVWVPQGTAVELETGSGDIALTGALGNTVLKVGSGDIDGSRLEVQSISFDTGSGDIDADFAREPGQVRAKTGSGDVSIGVPSGGAYAVTGESGSGDREVNVDTSPTSSRAISVTTGSGDVEVDYR